MKQPDDIVGLLAYALYKQNIRRSTTEGGPATPPANRAPGEVEIGAYRGLAERSLEQLASKALEEEAPNWFEAGKAEAQQAATKAVLSANREARDTLLAANHELRDDVLRTYRATSRIRSSTRFWVTFLAGLLSSLLAIAVAVAVVYAAPDWVLRTLHVEKTGP
ncbi:MAG: hypothetical protein JO227_03760 [Acetobacteraceae bacterium]|nr:hypothetical protein [Acetobacteraceae bacterium]